MTTRLVKIARLTRHVRNELNTRIQNGALGTDLVDWLNSLDETNQILATVFGGRPINEQNLSDWKRGGFLDWERQQDTRERALHFLDLPIGPADPAVHYNLPDRLSDILVAELASQTQQLLSETTDPALRFRYTHDAVRSLQMLRNADQAAFRTHKERQQWVAGMEKVDDDAGRSHDLETRDRLIARALISNWAPADRATLERFFGGGPRATAIVDQICSDTRP